RPAHPAAETAAARPHRPRSRPPALLRSAAGAGHARLATPPPRRRTAMRQLGQNAIRTITGGIDDAPPPPPAPGVSLVDWEALQQQLAWERDDPCRKHE